MLFNPKGKKNMKNVGEYCKRDGKKSPEFGMALWTFEAPIAS